MPNSWIIYHEKWSKSKNSEWTNRALSSSCEWFTILHYMTEFCRWYGLERTLQKFVYPKFCRSRCRPSVNPTFTHPPSVTISCPTQRSARSAQSVDFRVLFVSSRRTSKKIFESWSRMGKIAEIRDVRHIVGRYDLRNLGPKLCRTPLDWTGYRINLKNWRYRKSLLTMTRNTWQVAYRRLTGLGGGFVPWTSTSLFASLISLCMNQIMRSSRLVLHHIFYDANTSCAPRI